MLSLQIVAAEIRSWRLGRGNFQYDFQSRYDARAHHLTWEGDGEAALLGCLHKLSPSDLIKTLCCLTDIRDGIPYPPVPSPPTHEQALNSAPQPLHTAVLDVQVDIKAPDVTFKL